MPNHRQYPELIYIIIANTKSIQMYENNTPIRQILEQAHEKFASGQFAIAKTKLQQLTNTLSNSSSSALTDEEQKCLQLNKLLCDFETGSQDSCQIILGKLLNLLTQTNIQIYKKNRPKEINFISHEMLYLNILAIAEYVGKNTLGQLVGAEALFFFKCLQTYTALLLIYQNLRRCLIQNRLSTALQLIQKFQKIIQHCKNLSPQQQKIKTMINILFTSALLKLHMVEQSQALFMLKFDQNDADKFVNEQKSSRTKRKNKILFKDLMNFLKSQIDFLNNNHQQSINSMLQYSFSESNREKIYAQNNIAINLCMMGKSTAAQKIFMSNSQTLAKVLSTNKKYGTQIPELFQKTKQNIALSYLHSRQGQDSITHYNVEADQKCYNHITKTDDLFSFKQQYRRGQSCLNLYHSLLEKSSRKLPWQQIHDNYDNVYYYPNQPYILFKGRNKNVHLINKKPVYRRYVLNEWNDNPNEQAADKDQNRRKFEKQANSIKLTQILTKAQQSFKKSLILLQKQQAIIVNIQGPEADMNKVINERLFHQYAKFKSSLLCLLAYTALCLCKWNQTIKYCQEFQDKKCGDVSAENNYSVLTYQMQAFVQVNRVQQSYKAMHSMVSGGLSKTIQFDCRDGSNLSSCNVQKQMTQQLSFIYNMSVLHSRNNRIPQSHQSIQKLFTQMNVLQNYPKSELPLSTIDLLIHYNLRVQSLGGALQLIKRRRMVNHANSVKTVLNITK